MLGNFLLVNVTLVLSRFMSVFRIGKSLHHFQVVLQTIHLHNPVQRILVTLARINRGLYLLMDHVVWAGKVKLLNVNTGYWGRSAARFWLLAVIFSLCRDLYELWLALRVEQSRLRHDTTGGSQTLSTAVQRTLRNNPAVVLDTAKNTTDIFLPLQSLEYVSLPSGVIGLLGVASSLCGLASIWQDTLKLKYS